MSALPGRNLLDHPEPRPAVDVRNYKLIGKNCHVAVGMIAAIAAVAKSQGAANGEATNSGLPVVTSDDPYPKYSYDSNGTGTVGFIRSGFTTVGSHNYGDRTEQRISIDVPSVRDVFQERGRWSENCNGFDGATVARREANNFTALAGTTIDPKARFPFDTGGLNGPVPCYTALIAADANFSTFVSKWLQSSVQVTGTSVVGAWSYGGSGYTYGGCACLGWTAGTVAVDGWNGVSAPESYFDFATFATSEVAKRRRRDISGVSAHYPGENGAFGRTVPFAATNPGVVPSLFDNMEDLHPWSGTNVFSRERISSRSSGTAYDPFTLSDARIPAIELVLYPCRYEGYTWQLGLMAKEDGTGDGLVSPIADLVGSSLLRAGRSASNESSLAGDLLSTDASKEAFKNAVPSELGLKFTMAADVQTPEQRMDADPMAMAPPEASSDISTNEIVALSLSGAAILIAVVVAAMELRNSDIRCGRNAFEPMG